MDAQPIGGYTKVKIMTDGLYERDMDRRGDSIFETIKESFSLLTPTFLIGAFALAIQSFPLTAVLYHKLFFLLYHRLMRNKEDAYSTTFTRGIHCVPIIGICVGFSAIEAELISLWDGMNNFNDLVIAILSKPFETIGATFLGGFLIMFCESVLWMVGVHGGNVFDTLLTSQPTCLLSETEVL